MLYLQRFDAVSTAQNRRSTPWLMQHTLSDALIYGIRSTYIGPERKASV